MTRSALLLQLGFAVAAILPAQVPAFVPQFEVAAIKPCPHEPEGLRGVRKGESPPQSPDRLQLPCQTLLSLIRWAYVNFADGRFNPLASTPVSGGPPWLDSDLFAVDAKAAGPQNWGTLNGPMLRALLEERFNLKTRLASRTMPVYALTVAKGGPKLQRSVGNCIVLDPEHPSRTLEPGKLLPPLCGMSRLSGKGWEAFAVTMAEFAKSLSDSSDRKVVDRTGLSGKFDVRLALYSDDLRRASPAVSAFDQPANPPDPADVFARIRSAVQKLGLKLEPSTGAGNQLVIDRADKPADN